MQSLFSTSPLNPCPDWQARWSWLSAEENSPVSAVWAIAKVTLPEGAVELRFGGTHAYRLWWNGQQLPQGPDRADPRFLYGHSYPVAAKAGANALVALIFHYWPAHGQGMRSWCLRDGPPGVIAECVDKDGTVTPITWEMRRSSAWNEKAKPTSLFREPIQDFTPAIYEKERSEALQGKGGQWKSAATFEFNHGGFYPVPISREIPGLQTVIRRPVRISRFLPSTSAVANHRALFGYDPERILTVNAQETGPWLVFEFDVIYCGYPVLEIEGEGILDIHYGESAMLFKQETLHLNGGRVRYEGIEWRGGKYIALDCSRIRGTLKIFNVELADQVYPFEERGSFRCESRAWNQLWRVSRDTAWYGVRDHPMDCCGREQAIWIEDFYIQMMTAKACFGDMRPFRKAFLQSLRTMMDDGVVPVPGPASVGYNRNGEFLPWSLFPLSLSHVLYELLMWSPDAELAEWALPRIDRMLEFYTGYEDDRGFLVLDPAGKQHLQPYVGWNYSLCNGINSGVNGMYLTSLRHAAEAAAIASSPKLSHKWGQRAARLKQSLRNAFWLPDRNLFSGGEWKGERIDIISPTVNAWCALGGAIPENAAGAWAHAIAHDDAIIPPMTTYDATLLLMALARYDIADGVRNMLDGFFGSVIRANNGSLPEYWREHSGTTVSRGDDSSQCHPFGSGPAFVLQQYVLGVSPTNAGWKRIRIEPHALGLWSASGRVPSPLGDILISWERTDCSWELDIEIPEGMVADIALPRLGVEAQELTIDGNIATKIEFWKDFAAVANYDTAVRFGKHITGEIGSGRHWVKTRTL